MPKWTEEQQRAIDEDGTNIIVSAGAGSGKTAVLSERVIRKLEQGVDVDRLLILTFTKAAAFEMMIRIRDKIKEREHLKEQLDKIDSAYITTFDSFSLALVKKYHYVLGIKKDIKIASENIINIEKKKMIEEIFQDKYKQQNSLFFQMLEEYTLKDDEELQRLLLKINNQLDLKYDKEEYLKDYVKIYCSKEKEEELLQEFEGFLKRKLQAMKEILFELLEEVEEKYGQELEESLNFLLASKDYNEMIKYQEIPKKNLPRGSSERAKELKEKLFTRLKEFQSYLIYQNKEEIRTLHENTKSVLQIIVEILLELDYRVQLYKQEKDAYEFTDISKMAIRLVKENENIRATLKEQFNEIMIDEYQDTSDLQELFITCIANNNVYMVGDIKQSIYRFRNANPYIFKNKYDQYGKLQGGIKIDLMKNFRSRKEVLQNINDLFDPVMDEALGGCKYKEEHQMIFGNTGYEVNKKESQNANFEIYNYIPTKDFDYKKEEIEAFIVLKDIKEKIENKYQVIDKKTFKLRDCNYGDFTILMDRATDFDLYKKIFEHNNIPLSVYKDTSITKEDDIYILSNLLRLIYEVHHNSYEEDFRYAFISVARSYISDLTDPGIFHIMKTKDYGQSDIMKKVEPIIRSYAHLNGVELLEQVTIQFDLYEKQILVGNMDQFTARMEYIKTLFEEMSELGYSLDEIILNFNQMVKEEYDIKVSLTTKEEDAVKIMTIHKSKGLEFPILYMTGLSKGFNIRDLNDKWIYDNTYGIVIPYYKNQEMTNILKPMLKENYIQEEISEKIRLFYVALTRAKEKMILVTCNEKDEEEVTDVVDKSIRFEYRSFLDILKSIWGNFKTYQKEVNLEDISLTKDYTSIKTSNYQETLTKNQNKIVYQELKEQHQEISEQHFSKINTEVLSKETYDAIELGKRFNSILEYINFKKPDYSSLNNFEKKKIQAFLSLDILRDIETSKIYREYEFIYEENHSRKHGIIDLMIENKEKIIIIDYKLKQTMDPAYQKQLKGYQDYVKTKTQKKVETYLYSILDEELRQL